MKDAFTEHVCDLSGSPQCSGSMDVFSRSAVSDSVTPGSIAHQAPLCVAFPRQEYWSGLPFPSPGDLPDPGIKHGSLTSQADSLLSEPPGKLK